MNYVIWKINVATAEVVQIMPVWFTAMHEARAAADGLNEQYPSGRTGFQYVLKEVHSVVRRGDAASEPDAGALLRGR